MWRRPRRPRHDRRVRSIAALEDVAMGRGAPKSLPKQTITIVAVLAGDEEFARGVPGPGIVREVERVIGADEKKPAIDFRLGERGGFEKRATAFAAPEAGGLVRRLDRQAE